MFRGRRVERAGGEDPGGGKQLGRRRLLRLGGMAAAGAVGATAAGVAGAGSAGAAAGGTMILGGRNDSGIIDTRLTALSNKSALGVTNTSVGPALGATGRPIAAGGRIAAAGHGAALTVNGVASFSRGGVVEVPGDSASSVVEIAVPGGLTASSYVLATLQNPTKTTGNQVQQITAAEPLVTTGKVRIHLLGTPSLPSGVTLKIAWLVCG